MGVELNIPRPGIYKEYLKNI
jgi:hypothetical protein